MGYAYFENMKITSVERRGLMVYTEAREIGEAIMLLNCSSVERAQAVTDAINLVADITGLEVVSEDL